MHQYEGQPLKKLYNFFYRHLQILWILERDKNAEVFSYLSLFGLEYLYRCRRKIYSDQIVLGLPS